MRATTMKTKQLENALRLIRDAIRNKYGEGGAQVIIKESGISIDDEDSVIVLDEVTEKIAAEELSSSR